MSLREPCVEAIAAEILRWGIKPEKLPAGEKHLAGLVLDRLLAVLADHAEEWIVERANVSRPSHEVTLLRRISPRDVDDLLTVLKPTTEEDRE